ncbi:MAG: hypothetical protein A2541_00595 [Candidatus Taylorbacteria bacterium RIFOXYD2_FULL_36_9]|uniref:Uncharacterized protein n=1 Tax=Candidatus Taylorbacteria bacterium RIFOXYD2_FULL_36_9 TaxID=1802338 RepID=A0A1G2PDT0_9BACT|nr:MAG: hypothetical protein A2541_00595 [Candidatus Taylorbacteria bacterium RIFOXYD2_FULL_36_9]
MKLTYAKRIFIWSVIIFVLVLISDIIFTNLLLTKIMNINNKIRQLDISSQERLKELSLKDLIVSSETERKDLTDYFVGAGNAETVEITKYLENLAMEMGVTQRKTLDDDIISGLSSSETVSAIRFRLNVSGRWSNVFNFLQAIERLPKVLSLNSAILSVNSEATAIKEAGNKIWSADLDFSVVKLKN